MENDGYDGFIAKRLEKLKMELEPVFGLAKVSDKKLWRAERIKPDDPARKGGAWAKYCFTFEFPAQNVKANTDFTLDAFQPAIWAYCAGIEYLRTHDPALDDVFIDQTGEWSTSKRAAKTIEAYKKSENGSRQNVIVDPERVKKELDAAKAPKAIAHNLGVTTEAVYRVMRNNGLTSKKQAS